ncbi:hypothetical protein SRABI96_04428 [Peribacillus sp. Bi96]|uniref:hypothetical protein n=1 Tax=unclassified Peribacillus TaxID=2675266 RepID=UPI001D27A32C|nr:hypothetical protein [Peribacillus sp. Bi96]CAH0296001.1 hypothetical protein SRABI96_04428 [Peribacillus sp. Bi96]
MLLSKFKIRIRYMALTFILLFGGLTLSWVFASYYFEIMTMDYNAPDLVGSKEEIRHNFLAAISTWEIFVDSSMFYLINFIPVLFILPTLGLFTEKRSLYVLGRHRYPLIRKNVYRDVIQYVFLSTLTVVLTYLFFYSIGGIFVYRSLDNIGGFASILPQNFYSNHPYLFFVFMVCTIYLSLAFVFSLLAGALVLLLDREYKVILLILIIYFLYGKLGVYTQSVWFDIFSSFTAFNTLYSTLEVFLPLVILFIISIILLVVGVNKTVKNPES